MNRLVEQIVEQIRASLASPSFLVSFFFHCLFLAVPFTFTWVNEELFEFNKMLLTYGLTLLIGAAWAVRVIREQKLVFKRSVLDIPITIFVISQLLSTLFSIHPRTSFLGYYTRFNGGLLSTLTYVFLYYAFISNVTKKQFKSFLLTIGLAATLVALYAIPEHFGHSPSCLIINAQNNQVSFLDPRYFSSLFTVSCWVQDVQARVFATFGQPNWLAAYLITLIPIWLTLAINEASKQKYFRMGLFLLSAGLQITALIFTKSRSGILGLGAGLGIIAFSLMMYTWHHKKLSPALKWGSLISVLTIILPVLIFGTPFTPDLKSLLSSSNTELVSPVPAPIAPLEGGTESGEIRKIVWKGALEVWKRYPLLGSGVETFAYSYYQDRPLEHNLVSEWDFLYNKAHNEFLNFLATSGIVGLASYVALLLAIFWWLFKLTHLTKSGESNFSFWLAVGIAGGLAAMSVSNFFGFSTVMSNLLLFLLPAFAISLFPSKDKSLPTLSLSLTSQLVLIVMTLVLVFYGIRQIYQVWVADKEFALAKQYLSQQDYSQGVTLLQSAIERSPQEALFYDELADAYAEVAIVFARQEEATASSQLANSAISMSNQALSLNPRHLNFYKTRARMFVTLSPLNSEFLSEAEQTFTVAMGLAPTDPKLVYQRGLVKIAKGDEEGGVADIKRAIELKPNYPNPYYDLGKYYEDRGELVKAKENYQFILDNLIPNHDEVKQRLQRIEASLSAQKAS